MIGVMSYLSMININGFGGGRNRLQRNNRHDNDNCSAKPRSCSNYEYHAKVEQIDEAGIIQTFGIRLAMCTPSIIYLTVNSNNDITLAINVISQHHATAASHHNSDDDNDQSHNPNHDINNDNTRVMVAIDNIRC
jgi:hypothetical protein